MAAVFVNAVVPEQDRLVQRVSGPPRDRPVLYVTSLDEPVIEDGDYHHATRVLRLRDGTTITIADGHGHWRTASLAPRPEPIGDIKVEPLDRGVTVGVALIKALDVAVQKLTEVGVTEIVLLAAERNVIRWNDRDVERKLDRLHAIVRQAGTQSRRARLPILGGPLPVAEVRQRPGHVLAEPAAPPLVASDTVGVLVGPEGGWTPHERDGAATASLGRHILRAETAAIVAGALLMNIGSP